MEGGGPHDLQHRNHHGHAQADRDEAYLRDEASLRDEEGVEEEGEEGFHGVDRRGKGRTSEGAGGLQGRGREGDHGEEAVVGEEVHDEEDEGPGEYRFHDEGHGEDRAGHGEVDGVQICYRRICEPSVAPPHQQCAEHTARHHTA